MTIQIIPLLAVPSQTLSVTLASQPCLINVYQRSTGLFFDLYLNGEPILTAVHCHDRVLLIRYGYLGFVGDFSFFDTQGTNDPYYTGFSGRYFLAYGPDLGAEPLSATLPQFVPFGYIVEGGPAVFLSYDGLNPVAAYAP